jgi:hypothetical protein
MGNMPRTSAGKAYPHITTDAKKHECRLCDVIGKIAERARSGEEKWGTEHDMPLLSRSESEIAEIRRQLFAARYCRRLALVHGTLSVSVTYRGPDGSLINSPPVRLEGGYQLVVRVWSREQSKKEIVRRVAAGESLAYNVMALKDKS